MFQFIDLIAEYVAVCPYYKPTKMTYFLIILFLIIFSYVFILPLILFILYNPSIFILYNPSIFILLFIFLSCYYLAEDNRLYGEYYN